MNKYMPTMPAERAGEPTASGSTPQLSQLKKRMGPHGRSAFKQTTLMFGKKPKTSSDEVVDLSNS